MTTALAAALAAIALWSTLATLGHALAHLPPFLLTGIALLIGCVPGIARWQLWRVPFTTFALGVGGLFGFHLLLFVALRLAPPVEANLVNYLWPLLIVVLTPVVLPGWKLKPAHVVAALMGLVGASLAIGTAPGPRDAGALLGFGLAAGSALVWAGYSLLVRRVPAFSSWAIGAFALASGVLALACHALFEAPAVFRQHDGWKLAALGLGPMGAAFYLWDFAMKRGDPRIIGVIAYATPVASTLLLLLATGRPLTGAHALAAALIVGSAVMAMRIAR